VAEHEREAERARHLQTLADAQQAAIAENAAIARQLAELVTAHRAAANELSGWFWTVDDAIDVVRAAARLHDAVAALDPVACRTRVEGLGAASRASELVREVEQTLAKYERLRDSLARDRDALLRHGDPVAIVAAASDAMRGARQDEQSQQMALAAARVEREEDERIAGSLRQHAAEAICPTCARPLGPGEVERLADLLGARIEKLREEERNLRERAKAASASVAEAERAEAEARGRLEEVRALDQRLADGQRLIDEVRTRHEEAQASLHQALDAIDATEPPTPAAIEEARLVAERTNQLFSLGGLLARIGTDAQAVRDARAKAEAAMRDIGQVSYDPEGHQRAVSALDQARRAAARIEQIDVELAHRAAHEGQRAREERTLAEIAKRRAMVEAERQALGFDPVTLQGAIRAEQAARQAAHEAREEHALARQAVRDARAVLERLETERTHLQQLVETADEKAREADELSRMYDEFAEFDRYVARHVGPLLAETTERMLSQVTNGKYDHVQFDENYGIEVFDGDEAFPLSGFSGGERDVVALCARLALSEVVGSAALRPPRFLVLDEVFGSLDSERRAQLLETLGSLADGGHFRQMFIISHIDDVQYSPVMSEAWTVEERVGVSHVVRPPVASLARA
jgi:exonuclease SbcC